MLAVVLMLGELIRDFGVSQAAIQAASLTNRQASNLFWTNAAVGAVLTVGLSLAAPLVADMYHEPALTAITPWSALLFVINALQMQFQVDLARNHRFTALTATDAVSQLIGLVIGLVAALLGFGYWSLIIQMLSTAVTLVVLRGSVSRWRPGPPTLEPGMGALYRFSVHLGFTQLLNYGALNADSYTIGIRWGAAPLGVYNRAFQMLTVPANQLLAPLTNVVLPILAKKYHEGIDFYGTLWKAQIVLSSSLTFGFTLSASLAEPLVRTMLGAAWIESARLLTILSIGGAIQIFTFVAYWAFLASGNARTLFLQSLVIKPAQVACVIVGSFGGLEGVAWGLVIGLMLTWLISLRSLRDCDDMPSLKFLRSGSHVLFCGVIAGILILKLVDRLQSLPNYVVLPIGGVAAAAIYLPLLLSSPTIRDLLLEICHPPVTRAMKRMENLATAVRGSRH